MARRVYMLWTHPLFHDTVGLLLAHAQVEVVGASSVYAEALTAIETMQPDTVIMEETAENKSEVATAAMQILETSPACSRIIRMTLDDNDLWLYNREQWTINSREELIEVINT